jgi:3-oxoacyl-[acyl-carrier-protein] synthase III
MVMASMKICSVAHALPTCLVTNEALVDRIHARGEGTLAASELDVICAYLRRQLERTGACTRYHRAAGENALELGLSAGTKAMRTAGLPPDAIDLLIYTGVGRGYIEPATANVFQSELGLFNATCFDVLDACASWLRGVDIAHHLMASGGYRHAMILNCEANFTEYEPPCISSRDDMERLWSGYTVGEAATATIVSSGGTDAHYRASFRNAGSHIHDCEIPLPHAAQFQNGNGHKAAAMLFHARPNELASAAIRQLQRQYWNDPVLPSLDYDIVFGHSVSVPVSRTTLRALKLSPDRYYDIFPRYGNVVSASLPLAMSMAMADGRLRRGSRVLLIMGGAGITTALATFVF